MLLPTPLYCDPRIYRLFVSQLANLDDTSALIRAAVAPAMLQSSLVAPENVLRTITNFAETVRSRVQSQQPQALLANLHQFFFEELGFIGNHTRYYEAGNSYLPTVLETRQGIPITLTLIYKGVAEHLGLQVRGINAPGHFLAAVDLPTETMLVDSFYGGQVLSPDEAATRVAQRIGQPPRNPQDLFPTATHAQWLARILTNLQGIFVTRGERGHLAAITELQVALRDHLA
ncbi:MAG: transglutaminase-like domain-containing protein [Pirellulaceae bacterium]|nr:transglutaminase-like domain-containing protein [Pirellulaceae bacterium]